MKLFKMWIYYTLQKRIRLFAVIVLMFFMWKIFKEESEIIEALLLE